jgi:Flp pilus assembly protein TadG
MRRARGSSGQSTVEVVGLLPLLLAAALGVVSLLSAGAAQHAAGGAAEAGAVALLQGRDAQAAARAALGGWPARRTRITVHGRSVTVRVTPRGPLGSRLRATVSADAGPVSADSAARSGSSVRSSAPSRSTGGRP